MISETNRTAPVPTKAAETQPEKAAADCWKDRLAHLPPDEQAHIAKKYYGGHYPWKG